jgi:uncharacterized membrane protein YciS (DUF1049 family)
MADRRQSETSSGGDKRSNPAGGETARSKAASGGDRKSDASSPEDQVRAMYERAESTSARAFEELVAKPSFGSLMARSAEYVAAVARIGSEVGDLVCRNMRVAGRSDITRLARQLHRTEDKLERVLQEVEQLRDELGEWRGSGQSNGRDPNAGERAKADR